MRPLEPGDAGYLRDESRRSGRADWLALPASATNIATVLAHARANRIPVTLQGARTGITAGAVPDGGIVLAFDHMKRIAPAPPDPTTGAPRLVAEPGATLAEIRAACRPGWFFSPDPTETTASLGGMFSCNASGALSFRYGPVRDSVAAARILLEDGTTLDLERDHDRLDGLRLPLPGRTVHLPALPPPPAVKNAAGYFLRPDMDALDLFIGSEGTLGILAEATLILRPAPAERWALLAFPDAAPAGTAAAVDALRNAFRTAPPPGTVLAALEGFDARALAFLRARTDDPVAAQTPPGRAALYTEFHADSPDSAEQALLLASDCLESAGTPSSTAIVADSPALLARFKTFRHALPESVNALIDERRRAVPSIVKLGSDMSVPDERLADVLSLYADGLAASGLEHVVFGHIGNNHLHINILPRSEADMAAGRDLYRSFARSVVAWGGSLSAEHGIGKAKTDLLRLMYSPDALAAMSRIRDTLSPLRLLNPSNLGI